MKNIDDVKHVVVKIQALIEILLLTYIFFRCWSGLYERKLFAITGKKGIAVLVGMYAAMIVLVFCNTEGFKYGYLKIRNAVINQWVDIIIVNGLEYFQLCLIARRAIAVHPVLVMTAAQAILCFGWVYFCTFTYHKFSGPRKLLMIYGMDSSFALKLQLESRPDKYQVKKQINYQEGMDKIVPLINEYDAVVITDVPAMVRDDIIKYCYSIGKRIYVSPQITDVILEGAEDITLFDTPLLLVRSNGLSIEQRFLKRTVDIVLSVIALAVFWPFMLLIALAIKVEDGGPVFYKQCRLTRNNREFNIIKFRSMIVDAEKDGKSIPATDRDPRITRVGRVIRALRLDELPQLFNILRGDMSICGPRPERIEHCAAYTEQIPEFSFRSKVKGGLTGYAQVFGKYNTSPSDKLKLDMIYIERFSFLRDFQLILMTVATMFKKESTEGFAEQEKAPENEE